MQSIVVQRLRVTYAKIGPTRFIGHLDVIRTWERTLNRARLPVAYSQGFNRRPRMQFAAPLSLGHTGEAELVDLWMQAAVPPEQALAQLRAAAAPGLPVVHVAETAIKQPALPALLRAAHYRIELAHEPPDPADLAARVAAWLAQPTAPMRRGGKADGRAYDLRPLVLDLALTPGSDPPQLTLHVTAEEGRTGRPDDLLRALGFDPADARICRTALVLDATATEVTG